MTKFASIIATGAVALALSASLLASASAANYDPAQSYIEQFSGARGAQVHVPTAQQSSTIEDGAEDYANSLRNTFRAQQRQAGMPDNIGQGLTNRIN